MVESQTQTPILSIVIPLFNESKRIERSVSDLKTFFSSFAVPIEILLVVEKSDDDTLQKAFDLTIGDPRFRVIANDVHRGKGYAVKTGMLQAQGEVIFFMDLDLSTPLVEVVNFLGQFQSSPKTDIIIGSRQHKKSQILKRQNPMRQKMGQIFNWFVQRLALSGIKDTQCGFKAFRKKVVSPIFCLQTTNGFSFDVEVLLLAKAFNYNIEVLPVRWTNSTESKVRIFRDSFRMFFDLLWMRRRVVKTLASLAEKKSLR